MIDTSVKLTILNKEQVWGYGQELSVNENKQLDIFKKYGTMMAITDLSLLTGGYYNEFADKYYSESEKYRTPDDTSLKGRISTTWLQDIDLRDVSRRFAISADGELTSTNNHSREVTVLPVLKLSDALFSEITKNRRKGYNGINEVEFGEYAQYAPYIPNLDIQQLLREVYLSNNMKKTGRDYTFDSIYSDECEQEFEPETYEEYEYNGKRYICVKAKPGYIEFPAGYTLSDGKRYIGGYGTYVWVEISPVIWLIDDESKSLISKRGLLSGIRFCSNEKDYDGNFEETELSNYLNTYMLRDLFQSTILKDELEFKPQIKNIHNPYKDENILRRKNR